MLVLSAVPPEVSPGCDPWAVHSQPAARTAAFPPEWQAGESTGTSTLLSSAGVCPMETKVLKVRKGKIATH